MKLTSILNLGGFLLAALGSCTAMWGIFKQANGYYTFKATVWNFAQVVFSIFKTFLLNGKADAFELLDSHLNTNREEDRKQSLLGFFAVFAGFVLQLAGAALLYLATLADVSDCPCSH